MSSYLVVHNDAQDGILCFDTCKFIEKGEEEKCEKLFKLLNALPQSLLTFKSHLFTQE
jgi:hypothetical protein